MLYPLSYGRMGSVSHRGDAGRTSVTCRVAQPIHARLSRRELVLVEPGVDDTVGGLGALFSAGEWSVIPVGTYMPGICAGRDVTAEAFRAECPRHPLGAGNGGLGGAVGSTDLGPA